MNKPRAIERVRAGLQRRRNAERRFRRYGVAAVISGLVFLGLMFASIISNGYSAFHQHYARIAVHYSAEYIDDLNDLQGCDYDGIVKDALRELAPWLGGRRDRRALYRLISGDAAWALRDRVMANPDLVGKREEYWALLDDDADMFFKGYVTPVERLPMDSAIHITAGGDGRVTLSGDTAAFAPIREALRRRLQTRHRQSREALQDLERRLNEAGHDITTDAAARLRAEQNTLRAQVAEFADKLARDSLDGELPADFASYLIDIGGVYIKALRLSDGVLTGEVYATVGNLPPRVEQWQLVTLDTPAADRRLSDKQIAVLLGLESQGRVESRFNAIFFNSGDSREPEQAGILSALKGSMYMLVVTLVLSFPIGVATAVYLEEFAPQNRWTDFIEVNINNLAAVPSIVFGLLGLAVFLNFFGLPRSAPLVGGLVLTLMTLPTIIISGRAALKSVPPSIREAALGVGASRTQTVFYHVLPLALPGMLTGTIIGMAQALGESAPLLMIGMVAFIVDAPQGFTDPATALPVQIYLWADSPERAFVERTSAAIMVLLGFLISMNALAVILRKRFERRW